jgi:hypothetical protein
MVAKDYYALKTAYCIFSPTKQTNIEYFISTSINEVIISAYFLAEKHCFEIPR